MEKLKAAAYCRVSTDKDDQVNSLAGQRKYFSDYITSHETWQLSKIYYDEGISGTQTKNRAGFNAMIRDALQGKIDLILTKEVSRFARNTVDTLSYTRKLKDAGIGVIFTLDNIDTRDADGELRLTIMASIAQEESRKTSERVKWGQKRRMEQGVVFGRDLLGYTVKNGTLAVNQAEVPTVRAIFHKYTNEGKGTHIIARELTKEGLLPKRSDQWSNVSILRILKNEKYAGDLCQKKTFTPDYLTHIRKSNKNPEEMVYLYDHHEPIIDRELWTQTQQELARRSPVYHHPYRYSSRCWCSGKIYCGICGRPYVSRTKKRSDETLYRAWRCHTKSCGKGLEKNKTSPLTDCPNYSINEQALLDCIHFCLRHLSIDKKNLKSEILQDLRACQKTQSKTNSSEKLREQILHIQEKKQEAVHLYLEGILTKEELLKQKEWYDDKLVTLEQKKKTCLQNKQIYNIQAFDSEQYLSVLDEILNFPKTDTKLYGEILHSITIYKEKILDVRLKCLPFRIRLNIRTYGKRQTFTTEFLHMQIFKASEDVQ